MKKTVRLAALVVASSAPLSAFAAAQTFANIVNGTIVPFFDAVLFPFMYAIAFVFFFWGLFIFFFTGGEENRTKGKQFAVGGIIGFVVMFSVWGIVKILMDFLLHGR